MNTNGHRYSPLTQPLPRATWRTHRGGEEPDTQSICSLIWLRRVFVKSHRSRQCASGTDDCHHVAAVLHVGGTT